MLTASYIGHVSYRYTTYRLSGFFSFSIYCSLNCCCLTWLRYFDNFNSIASTHSSIDFN